MTMETARRFVLAEMNTHHFQFRGAGETREDAKSALLRAWALHRNALLARYPERSDSIPEADQMEAHFRICYLEFEVGAGYRDGDRLL